MSFGPSLRCPQPRRIRLLKSICSLKTPLPSISAKQGGVNGELARSIRISAGNRVVKVMKSTKREECKL
ncbi:hypothetical protein V6Z11_A07G109500 [Gossypium hirsutum]